MCFDSAFGLETERSLDYIARGNLSCYGSGSTKPSCMENFPSICTALHSAYIGKIETYQQCVNLLRE